MRTILAGLLGLSLLAGAADAAQGERRMFIIPNDADGYGIDRCLANGEHCGRAAANTYCQTHQFAQAMTYHKVDREEITGAIPADASGGCKAGRCDNLVAIVCTR
jgi:hypothetical protein